jgi:SAM-dependent methyltransferase
MMLEPPPLAGGWEPAQIHTDTPHPARMYDYYLGGKDNYSVDTAAAEQVLAVFPRLREIAQANRAFLGRALRSAFYEHGIRQLLDIGTGLPGIAHPGDVARALDADSRAAFVDNDPIVVTHARARLCRGAARALQADLRDPASLLAQPALQAALDLREPVALVLGFVLHYLTDADRPGDVVNVLIDALAPGSVVILSHATAEGEPQAALEAAALYQSLGMPVTLRGPAQIAELLDGLDVLEPGITAQPWWRPDYSPAEVRVMNWGYGAMGIKPGRVRPSCPDRQRAEHR